MTDSLDRFAASVEMDSSPQERRLPPVEEWNPPLSGDIDIWIDNEGVWYHEGTAFQRQDLARLFASILVREGDDYFLVSPVEKWRIRVDDVPFVFVLMEVEAPGRPEQKLRFRSQLGDEVVAGEAHPILLHPFGADAQLLPYVNLRRNLEGRVSRNVFYQLVDLAEPRLLADGRHAMGVVSDGWFFPLE